MSAAPLPPSPRRPWSATDVVLVLVVVVSVVTSAWTLADRGQRCALLGCDDAPQDLALGLDDAGLPIVVVGPCSVDDVEGVRVLLDETGGVRRDTTVLWEVSRPDPQRDDPTVVAFPERRSEVARFELGVVPDGFVERVRLDEAPAAAAGRVGGVVVTYDRNGERLLVGGLDGLAPGQVSVRGEPSTPEAFLAQARDGAVCRRSRGALATSLPLGAFLVALASAGALTARRLGPSRRRVWDSNPR
ncbi:MAG: hypothetical protein MUF83_18330 [Acidimicrobiales bacterium]|nr:hypothetical protein [Acidimicrobiales bacterium]